MSAPWESWVGFDLDGTLAHYDGWHGVFHIGEPIMPMVDILTDYLARGVPVRIFTARVCNGDPETRKHIEDWCNKHIGQVLPVTCIKDYGMTLLYDDRAVAVEENTGLTKAFRVHGGSR